MGMYLMSLAVHDVLYRNKYNQYSLDWTMSWRCQVTGLLAMMSSEVSIVILAFMSVERFLTITFPYRTAKLGVKKAKVGVTVLV